MEAGRRRCKRCGKYFYHFFRPHLKIPDKGFCGAVCKTLYKAGKFKGKFLGPLTPPPPSGNLSPLFPETPSRNLSPSNKKIPITFHRPVRSFFLSVTTISFLYMYTSLPDRPKENPLKPPDDTVKASIEKTAVEGTVNPLVPEDTGRSIKPPGKPSGKPQGRVPDITRGSIAGMDISVTFDGGYDGKDAEAILKTLRERGIKTTIFLTGEFIKRYPAVVREIVHDGHEVGNHTMNHPHLTDFERTLTQTALPNVTREFVSKELGEASELFKRVTGAEMAPLWRAPYGEVNSAIRAWAFEGGYVHIGWTANYERKETLDSLDWVDDRSSRLYRSSREIKERILNFGSDGPGLRGGIILMHLGTNREDRVSKVLGEILDSLSERGYRFVKVSELIEGDERLAGSKNLLARAR